MRSRRSKKRVLSPSCFARFHRTEVDTSKSASVVDIIKMILKTFPALEKLKSLSVASEISLLVCHKGVEALMM